jgi:magnesium-transporting ATPase (P-type)
LLGPLEAVAGLAAFFFVLYGGGWHYGQGLAGNDPLYLQATTACLTAIIIAQVANLFICRSEDDSALSRGLSGNRLLLPGVALALLLILAIDYTPPGNWRFGTAPISAGTWLFAVPFALALLGADEPRKGLRRRRTCPLPSAPHSPSEPSRAASRRATSLPLPPPRAASATPARPA